MDKLVGRTGIVRGMGAAGLAMAVAVAMAAASCGSSNNGGAGGQTGAGGHGGGAVNGAGGGGGQAAGVGGHTGGPPDAASDAAPTALSFPFTSDAEGFALDTTPIPGPYTDGNPQNLGGAIDAGPLPVVGFDSAFGMPPGSLTITATFTDFNQTVNVRRVNLSSVPPGTISLIGKTLTAMVRLDPGTTTTATVHLFALSTPSPHGYYFAQGNSILLGDNDWHTLTFNLAVPEFAAAGFDVTDIVQIGVQIASGARAATATTVYGAPQSIALHFDSVTTN